MEKVINKIKQLTLKTDDLENKDILQSCLTIVCQTSPYTIWDGGEPGKTWWLNFSKVQGEPEKLRLHSIDKNTQRQHTELCLALLEKTGNKSIFSLEGIGASNWRFRIYVDDLKDKASNVDIWVEDDTETKSYQVQHYADVDRG